MEVRKMIVRVKSGRLNRGVIPSRISGIMEANGARFHIEDGKGPRVTGAFIDPSSVVLRGKDGGSVMIDYPEGAVVAVSTYQKGTVVEAAYTNDAYVREEAGILLEREQRIGVDLGLVVDATKRSSFGNTTEVVADGIEVPEDTFMVVHPRVDSVDLKKDERTTDRERWVLTISARLDGTYRYQQHDGPYNQINYHRDHEEECRITVVSSSAPERLVIGSRTNVNVYAIEHKQQAGEEAA